VRLPIYLDHNSTTPVDPSVLEAMLPFFGRTFGNAASKTHSFGWDADRAVEEARARIASPLGARPREIVLTSGATEANNLAILGIAARRGSAGELITGQTEHRAVLDPCRELERRGWTIHRLAPDRAGRITAEQVRAALTPQTALVSLMAANNETGVLHPLAEICAVTRAAHVPFHSDAAQAFGRIPLDVETLGVDLLSISAHKIHGPKGIGALYVRSRPRAPVAPIIFGGGHEGGLRSGTVAVPLAVGFGVAAELASARREADGAHVHALAERLWSGIAARVPGAVRHGYPAERLPGTVSIGFPGVEAAALLLGLPELALSSGSACTSAELEPSHVLRAMGVPAALAHGSIRFGLGRSNRADEIEFAIERVAAVVARLRGGDRAVGARGALSPRDAARP
jgi:cysteine desulfurase